MIDPGFVSFSASGCSKKISYTCGPVASVGDVVVEVAGVEPREAEAEDVVDDEAVDVVVPEETALVAAAADEAVLLFFACGTLFGAFSTFSSSLVRSFMYVFPAAYMRRAASLNMREKHSWHGAGVRMSGSSFFTFLPQLKYWTRWFS